MRLPAQERNGLTRSPSVDDLAVRMGHLQQGKRGRHLTNGIVHRKGTFVVFSSDKGGL